VSLRASSIPLYQCPLLGEFPKQQRVFILAEFFLHAVARVGSHNKLGGQFLHFPIRPD
jgi:hypothetical protein